MAFLDHQALFTIVSVFVAIVILCGDAIWNRDKGSLQIGGTTAVAAMLTYVLGYLAQTDAKIAVVLAVYSVDGRCVATLRCGAPGPGPRGKSRNSWTPRRFSSPRTWRLMAE